MVLLRYLFSGLITCLLLSSSGLNTKHNEIDRRDHQKARYYYLEGLRVQEEDPSAAYDYFRHAYSIDPTYTEALSAIGSSRLRSSLDTLRTPREQHRSLAMMRPYTDKYPEDVNEALAYGYFAYALGNNSEAIRVFSRTDSLRPDRTSLLGHLAKAYMAEGMIDSAINTLSKYERIEGHDPNLTIEKVTYQFAKHDTVAALQEVTNLVNSNPREPSYLILKGNIFGMIQRPDSAFKYFTMAEELNPESGGPQLALADYYRNLGDSAMYDAKTYRALISEDFTIDQKIGLLGEYLQALLSNSKQTERGDTLFETLRTQYPHEAKLLDLSARYSAAKGNYDEAIDEIGYAISQSPSNEQYRGQLMTYCLAAGRPEDAMATYREVKKFSPTPMSGLITLYATAAQQTGNYKEAVNAYHDLIDGIEPGLPIDTTFSLRQLSSTISYEDMMRLAQVYTMLGDAYYMDKNATKAFNAYENSLLLDPDNALTLNNYAYFLSEEGKDLERAREMSEKSLGGENGNNPTYLDTYAWILYKAGDYDDAAKYQQSAIKAAEENNNESSDLYEHYGDILLKLGKRDEALDNYQRAIKFDDHSSGLKDKINNLKHKR